MKNQQEMMREYLPLLDENGWIYDKFTEVEARIAVPGEKVITETSDGKETENIAKPGDFVVRNLTKAREQYILSSEKLAVRYLRIENKETKLPWRRYKAIGSIRAMQYRGESVKFIAAWGEEMQLHDGDMLCMPLPKKDEIYRVAAKEFSETYRRRL